MKVISIHNFISSSGSDFLTSYGSGSGSTSQKVTVPMVPVPQHCCYCCFHCLLLASSAIPVVFCAAVWGAGDMLVTLLFVAALTRVSAVADIPTAVEVPFATDVSNAPPVPAIFRFASVVGISFVVDSILLLVSCCCWLPCCCCYQIFSCF
jgi:hypothetical protein